MLVEFMASPFWQQGTPNMYTEITDNTSVDVQKEGFSGAATEWIRSFPHGQNLEQRVLAMRRMLDT